MSSRKTIIITGGASGIGLGIAQWLSSKKTDLYILDINNASGLQVASELALQHPNSRISFRKCDISSWDEQAAVFSDIFRISGRIDLVIANAGISPVENLLNDEPIPTKPSVKVIDINLMGMIWTVKLAIHYLGRNEINPSTNSAGSIICTSSSAGIYAFPVGPMYSASKHGVIGLVRSLASPLTAKAIQINALAPVVIKTNIAQDDSIFAAMVVTPMSTLTKGVDLFMRDSSLTGQVLEVHGENATICPPRPYVDDGNEHNYKVFASLGHA